ncbi:Gip2p PWA37_005350 [Arxiozyma heterogenica]|uniref:Gip2p n=1 Tax=Arxiozyma heterogenica TaxID=278026 RepID=UPI002F117D5A
MVVIEHENRNINKDKSIENCDSFNRSANRSHNQTPSHSTFSHVIGSSNHSKADAHKFLRKISSESKLPLKANKSKGDNNNSLQPGIISNHHFSSVSNSRSNFISPFISPSNSNLTPPSSSSSTFSYNNNDNDNDNNNTKEIYSLKFLHKPQRVKQFNSARFPEEILQRNTDLNKQITLDLPPLSPKSALPTDQVDPLNNINYTINSYENYENDAFNYLNNDSSDSFLNLNTPVYKKSGELVKSSLKRRSKSLPSTPAAAAAGAANGFNSNSGKQPVLLRSKSVHFDQRAPVKYFISDESPMNVYSKDEFEDMLKFNLLNKAKKLGQVAKLNNNNSDDNNENVDESAEEDLLIKFKKLLLEEKRHLLQRDQPVDKESVSEEETSMTKNSNDKEKPLRKSKRFQGIASKQKNPNQLDDNNTVNNNNNNDHDDNDNDNGNSSRQIDIDRVLQSRISKIPSETKITIDSLMLNNDDLSNTNNSIREIIKVKSKKKVLNKMRTNKVVGLYNQNFPILSNKNPKSLKLNIFVSLSQDKKVFLQEISLHIHQRNFMSPNFKTIGSATNTTRYIIGKVMVKNIYYDKRVTVRYTWNNWNTINEVECLWLSNGDSVLPGTNMDVFHFLIADTNKIDTVGKLEFCICYVTRNDRERLEFWDNNDGKNYKVEVVMNGFNNPFTL